MNNLLSITSLNAFYGSSQALFDIDLTLQEGQVTALMGRNGMGKSTTIKSICRMMPKWSGEIIFDGHDLAKLATHKAARLGLGLVPEGRRCFPNLTVLENCLAAARTRDDIGLAGQWDFEAVSKLFPRLEERRNQMANTLSGGEQQMLAIGRALMTNPKLLLLDEATEGLAPIIREEIWAAIRQLKQTGLSILLVDKSFNEIMRIADTCIILQNGTVHWNGAAGDLTSQDKDELLGV